MMAPELYMFYFMAVFLSINQSGLRDYWNRDDMTEADKFLKDYILEKKYLAEESENRYVCIIYFIRDVYLTAAM